MADENTDVNVKMLVVSGRTEDSQFFDYRPSFFGDIVRVEWDLDTMEAAINHTVADYLINHGYAIRLSPELEPAPIVTEEEPLVVETVVPDPSSLPAQDEAEQAPPPSPTPPQSPQAEEPKSTSSSGGKRQKKEKQKSSR